MSDINIKITGKQGVGKSVILTQIYALLCRHGYTSVDTDGSESFITIVNSTDNAIPFRDATIMLSSSNSEKEIGGFSFSEIGDLVEEYLLKLQEERICMKNVVNARIAADTERSRIIFNARGEGLINGKNESERSDQITALLETGAANGLYWLEKYLADCEHDLEMVEIHRKALETEISLTKAWLYSQSGAGK